MKARAYRTKRRSEGGMTLIELLVVCSILSIIGTVIMVAFSVGIVAFGGGGVTDRTTAADDLIVFEQHLGEDVARAACIEAPQSSTTYGSCSNSLKNASTPCVSSGSTKSLLCVSWPQPQSAGSTTFVCHTAVYSPAGSVITRKETYPGGATGQTHISLDPVSVGSVTLVPPSYPPPGVSWIAQVTVSNVRSANASLRNPPTVTFQLQPLTVNPAAVTVAAVC